MTKPKFNPALPYTFEDTEKDKRELRKALVEWSSITDKFNSENVFFTKDHTPLRWSNSDYCIQYFPTLVQSWVELKSPIRYPVTYTPPEPIRVIMSGERFEIDGIENHYFQMSDLFNNDIVCEAEIQGLECHGRSELKDFLKKYPNWHTAKLVEEKKPEPRVFKDWEEFLDFGCDTCDLKITFVNNVSYNMIYRSEDSEDRGYVRGLLHAGAKVELVEG